MNVDENGTVIESPKRYRRIVAIVVLTPVLIGWLVWGPLGIISYAGGLFNYMQSFVVLFFLMVPALGAVVAFLVLSVFAAVTWERQNRRNRRAHLVWIMLTGGFACPMILGFTGLSTSPFDAYVRGFRRYAEWHADIAGIQGWLATVDPNDYLGENGMIDEPSVESELPPCVAELAPRYVMVQPDDVGRPMVQLLWGSGMIGSWGIDVGREDMPALPAGADEQYYPLQAGAYIWSTE